MRSPNGACFYRVIDTTVGWLIELFDAEQKFLHTIGSSDLYWGTVGRRFPTRTDAESFVSQTYPDLTDLYAGLENFRPEYNPTLRKVEP